MQKLKNNKNIPHKKVSTLKSILKKIGKGILILISLPILYFLFSILLSAFTVNKNHQTPNDEYSIYISTNGVHLDISIPTEYLEENFKNQLNITPSTQFISFGWGDKDFYLNTPEWKDLKAQTAIQAIFLKSETLMHVYKLNALSENATPIPLNEKKLQKLFFYISSSFQKNSEENMIHLENKSYGNNDDFYKAIGSYSLFKTCNTWVNSALKESDLKACFWTPFDFTLLNKYEK